MSDYLPFDIQAEIIKRIPVRSLLQFRSVSKAWKSHIDSSDFIACYRGQQQHLLVGYRTSYEELRYVSFVDDHTFPEHKVTLTVPHLVKMLKKFSIVGSSHGLLCLYGDYQNGRYGPFYRTGRVVLWNLSLRRAIAVVSNVVKNRSYITTLGFGVCRKTNDRKILKITHFTSPSDRKRVEVFTLSTGAWRSLHNGNLPRDSIYFGDFQVVIDGFLYWLATSSITTYGYNLIISIDMTSEEFREVNFPDSLAHACGGHDYNLSMCKLNESLVVLEPNEKADNLVTNVWIMEDGVQKSFSKLFTIDINTPKAFVRGFRKTAEPIIEIKKSRARGSAYASLLVFEPYSKPIYSLGITGYIYPSCVHPYMETLLLLDQPDLMVYDKDEHYISE